jgi:Tol biopolymer transport system component
MTSWPALSSDARLIAYVSDSGHDGSTPQIYVQQIGGTALRLTDGEHAYSHLAFSADDTRIIYTVTDASGPDVYEVPTLGGDPRLLQRGASRGAMSADGRWLCSVGRDAAGIRIAARGGIGFRTVAPDLVDVACLAWSPDSRSVLVHARSEPAQEAEWWIVPIEGSSPTNTGVVRQFRESGMFTVPSGVAWMEDSFVISAAGPQGICLYRQRIVPSTFQSAGPPQRLTDGSDSAWLPAAAAGRLAFVNSRTDANLWSIALDAASGTTRGPLRRLTRGPGILGNLSLTSELDTLAYFSVRLGQGDIFLRDLCRDSERVVNEGPPGGKWDPAISPSGRRLACANRTSTAERALRPIFVIDLLDGTWRQLGDDCGGRPREWVDERRLIIQRFARPNSIAMIDIETGDQVELLKSPERSVANARLSPDRRWVAFESARHGELPAVFVSPLREEPIPEAEWIEVERAASHPFWSADGTLLYYATVGTNPLIRSLIRARRFDPDGGIAPGEPMAAFSASDASMPAYLPGMAPIATRDQILLVLGDFTGDVWLMDLRSSVS